MGSFNCNECAFKHASVALVHRVYEELGTTQQPRIARDDLVNTLLPILAEELTHLEHNDLIHVMLFVGAVAIVETSTSDKEDLRSLRHQVVIRFSTGNVCVTDSEVREVARRTPAIGQAQANMLLAALHMTEAEGWPEAEMGAKAFNACIAAQTKAINTQMLAPSPTARGEVGANG